MAIAKHSYSHVTPGWRLACQLTDQVQNALGATIIDNSCGKRWDAGQAICREAYGIDWMSSPDFHAASASDEAPEEYLAAARRLIAAIPDWLRETSEVA